MLALFERQSQTLDNLKFGFNKKRKQLKKIDFSLILRDINFYAFGHMKLNSSLIFHKLTPTHCLGLSCLLNTNLIANSTLSQFCSLNIWARLKTFVKIIRSRQIFAQEGIHLDIEEEFLNYIFTFYVKWSHNLHDLLLQIVRIFGAAILVTLYIYTYIFPEK
ncbi:hypothetical protein BpHYR1_033282 [Brachionus plicatilis]|uniref:Uncharacterized protein n=1 Tax=Brachionus plicatilis TaxID=10195 RepID=A0A3M7R7L3_BRAPC|nr:hypothetical protein BpHYR1_033282 [Brachionus plicatilis]